MLWRQTSILFGRVLCFISFWANRCANVYVRVCTCTMISQWRQHTCNIFGTYECIFLIVIVPHISFGPSSTEFFSQWNTNCCHVALCLIKDEYYAQIQKHSGGKHVSILQDWTHNALVDTHSRKPTVTYTPTENYVSIGFEQDLCFVNVNRVKQVLRFINIAD